MIVTNPERVFLKHKKTHFHRQAQVYFATFQGENVAVVNYPDSLVYCCLFVLFISDTISDYNSIDLELRLVYIQWNLFVANPNGQ